MLPEAALRPTLPPLPDKFERRLADVASYHGNPMFRIVDGTREQTWRNGEWETKHLLHTETQNCYVQVATTVFRRKDRKTKEYKFYSTRDEAVKDRGPNLALNIEASTGQRLVAIGKPCWVVEVFIGPENIDEATWNAQRWQWLEWRGVNQKVDMLGEYPRQGMYVWCFDVIDDDGNAVSPSERTLDECRRRFKIASGETQTVDQAIQCDTNAMKRFEERTLERLNDNFLQWAGITANRQRDGVVGRPIQTN